MNPAPSAPTPVQETIPVQESLRVMAASSARNQLSQEALKNLNPEERREQIFNIIKQTYALTNEQVSDDSIRAAILEEEQHKWALPAAQEPLAYKTARVWAEHTRHWKQKGIPAVKGLAAIAVLATVGGVIYNVTQNSKELSAEQAVIQAFQDRKAAETQLIQLENAPSLSKLPPAERAEIRSIVEGARQTLRVSDLFFNKYCPDGDAANAVTRENYKEANQDLTSARDVLNQVAAQENKGFAFLKFQDDLSSTLQALNNTYEGIKAAKPKKNLLTQAQAAYDAGVASVTHRQLDDARHNVNRLTELKATVDMLVAIPVQVDQAYQGVLAVAIPDSTKKRAERLHHQAEVAIEQTDVSRLNDALSELNDLDQLVRQEYDVRIRSDKTGDSRVWYPDTKNPNSISPEEKEAGKLFYLFVSAYDKKTGDVTPCTIRDEEDYNRPYRNVTRWGERLPIPDFNAVRDYKKRTRRIPTDPIATKRRGYESPDYQAIEVDGRRIQFQNRGQITHLEGFFKPSD
jgi:hypothetical protein